MEVYGGSRGKTPRILTHNQIEVSCQFQIPATSAVTCVHIVQGTGSPEGRYWYDGGEDRDPWPWLGLLIVLMMEQQTLPKRW
jgi:hypothetical protein